MADCASLIRPTGNGHEQLFVVVASAVSGSVVWAGKEVFKGQLAVCDLRVRARGGGIYGALLGCGGKPAALCERADFPVFYRTADDAGDRDGGYSGDREGVVGDIRDWAGVAGGGDEVWAYRAGRETVDDDRGGGDPAERIDEIVLGAGARFLFS